MIPLEVFRREALDIAREVHQRALYARDGGIYWSQPAPRQPKPGPARPLDPYIYPGMMGIALFFALASRVLKVREYRPLALQIVEPVRRELRVMAWDAEQERRIHRPIGGFVGLGSLVYGMLRLGDILEDPVLWDDALKLTMLITPERLSEAPLEVMTGAAGAVLALLALVDRRPQANPNGHKPLDLALAAAVPLLRTSWTGQDNSRQGEDPPSIGFCHGASGIVYALARLAHRTGCADLDEAARKGWAYIETAYDPQTANWHLPHRGRIAGDSWCNGATGILFAGLEQAEEQACDFGSLSPSVAGALRTVATSPLAENDHLCCGNMGRVDALIHVASRHRPEMLESAQLLAIKVVERAKDQGFYRLMFYPQDLVDLRLFPGLTGIGYTLLRLVAPEIIPSLLSLA